MRREGRDKINKIIVHKELKVEDIIYEIRKSK